MMPPPEIFVSDFFQPCSAPASGGISTSRRKLDAFLAVVR
jgi:hypothetical protein